MHCVTGFYGNSKCIIFNLAKLFIINNTVNFLHESFKCLHTRMVTSLKRLHKHGVYLMTAVLWDVAL
jgi:hypothetical protein